jgi:chemotaxis protein MotB
MASRAGANVRPIIVRRIKKTAHAHHGGAWKVAYADFVTAMMAFFMLLWLISNPDKEQLKGLAEYFSPAPPSSSTSTTMTAVPGDMAGIGGRTRRAQADSARAMGQTSYEAGLAGAARGGTADVPDASMRVLAQELRVMMDPASGGSAPAARVEEDSRGLRINLMDTADRSMFRPGTAELNPYARETLAKAAAMIARSGARISVEGHTDGVGGQSEANWRLSGERALAARRALVEAGLTPDRFSEVVARGASEPVYPGEPDRPENRRITLLLVGEAPALPATAGFKF